MNSAAHGQKNLAKITTPMTVPHMAVQRKCACGGSGGLTGNCSECENKKLLGQAAANQAAHQRTGRRIRTRSGSSGGAGDADGGAESRLRPIATRCDSVIQRRVADEGGASTNVQRQEETPEGSRRLRVFRKPKTGADKEEGSRCPSWRQDPQSISKRAAENYVQNDMTPPSQATVEKIDCEPPRANGNYGCYVHFSDGLVIRVIVRETDIVVGMGPGPFTTLTPPPGTPLCFYDYHCPDGLLVLTKRECKSAKPAASSGPTLVGQRRAAPGASGALDAAPAVGRVLDTAGQPLDAATQSFFAARFGHDFANVRVHADAQAAASARSVNALAYTVGSHVVFGAGQFSPGTRAGRQLLAHELAHVVQQTGRSTSAAQAATEHRDGGDSANASIPRPVHPMRTGLIQRQPQPDRGQSCAICRFFSKSSNWT